MHMLCQLAGLTEDRAGAFTSALHPHPIGINIYLLICAGSAGFTHLSHVPAWAYANVQMGLNPN